MADPPGRYYDSPPPVQTTHNPFHGLLDKANHALHTAGNAIHDKAVDVSHDPNVRNGAHVAGNIGIGVAQSFKNDGLATADAARHGDVLGVAAHVAPLAIGGGVPALVVREVLPRVAGEALKQMPEGTRNQIESSGAGRLAFGAMQHGIPHSTGDVTRIVAQNAKESLFSGAMHNFHDIPTASISIGVNTPRTTARMAEQAPIHYPVQQDVQPAYGQTAYGQTGYGRTVAGQTGYGQTVAGQPGYGQANYAAAEQAQVRTVPPVHQQVGPPVSHQQTDRLTSQLTAGIEPVTFKMPVVTDAMVRNFNHSTAPAALAKSSESGSEKPNVVTHSNQVFPSWMK